ncbi:MAG TPA: alpha/beta fold hydrolase [Verrucomicrobium sp.]|nr:alpha/beta fold hydrolase [Verrucomicrobium sp.]
MKRHWLRKMLVLSALGVLAALAFVFYTGWELAAPTPRIIGPPPQGFAAEAVHLPSGTGSTLAGWLGRSTSEPVKGAVLLMHGIRSDRQSMVGRAKILVAHGYHTLCIDLQAHGESPGEHITMGHLESQNAAAALTYLRSQSPGLPVVVIGSSLGGVAALEAPYDAPPDAMIIEAVFSDVTTAVENRLEMRLGAPARVLSPLLTLQSKWLLGIDLAKISPVNAAARVRCPVLVIHGSLDRHAAISEGRAIFEHLAGPKEFWEVSGAAHVDLYKYAPAEYEERVIKFIEAALSDVSS